MRPTSPPRWPFRAVAAVVVALTLTGCGAATQSPKQQSDRERKAAGLAHFVIVCPPDLWDRTGGKHHMAASGHDGQIPAKITNRPDGLITVDLSGPNLIDLLQVLDYNAHPGWLNGPRDPLAIRLYDAIAPVLDKVGTPTTPSDVTPKVVINDTVPGRGAPTASPSKTAKN